jgi:hypothetical protein
MRKPSKIKVHLAIMNYVWDCGTTGAKVCTWNKTKVTCKRCINSNRELRTFHANRNAL